MNKLLWAARIGFILILVSLGLTFFIGYAAIIVFFVGYGLVIGSITLSGRGKKESTK